MASLSTAPVEISMVFPSMVLKYDSEWPGENAQNLSPDKCVQCMFPLKGNADISPDPNATINGNASSTAVPATYLGVS